MLPVSLVHETTADSTAQLEWLILTKQFISRTDCSYCCFVIWLGWCSFLWGLIRPSSTTFFTEGQLGSDLHREAPWCWEVYGSLQLFNILFVQDTQKVCIENQWLPLTFRRLHRVVFITSCTPTIILRYYILYSTDLNRKVPDSTIWAQKHAETCRNSCSDAKVLWCWSWARKLFEKLRRKWWSDTNANPDPERLLPGLQPRIHACGSSRAAACMSLRSCCPSVPGAANSAGVLGW